MSRAINRPLCGMRFARTAVAAMLAITMIGCANRPKPLYQWEGYQRQVYDYLKREGASPSEQLAAMQEQVDKSRADAAALPPGFRAHVGLLYLQLGRLEEAQSMFMAEKTTFPEATTYMDFLLKGMRGGKASGADAPPPGAVPAASATQS